MNAIGARRPRNIRPLIYQDFGRCPAAGFDYGPGKFPQVTRGKIFFADLNVFNPGGNLLPNDREQRP
jgi:hypothetical protein